MSEEDKLLELANAATPGEREAWSSIYDGMVAAIVIPSCDPLRTIAEVRSNYDDAKFLAACSPETVKALVEGKRELVEALATISNWLVCGAITTPEDMAQSFEAMSQIAEAALTKNGVSA